MQCNRIEHNTSLCTAQFFTIQYNVTQYNSMLYCTILYHTVSNATQYNAIQNYSTQINVYDTTASSSLYRAVNPLYCAFSYNSLITTYVIFNNPYYNIPFRNFNYDDKFNKNENVPPLTPKASYVKQSSFNRTY